MRKIIFIGRSECGKTSLTQAMRGISDESISEVLLGDSELGLGTGMFEANPRMYV